MDTNGSEEHIYKHLHSYSSRILQHIDSSIENATKCDVLELFAIPVNLIVLFLKAFDIGTKHKMLNQIIYSHFIVAGLHFFEFKEFHNLMMTFDHIIRDKSRYMIPRQKPSKTIEQLTLLNDNEDMHDTAINILRHYDKNMINVRELSSYLHDCFDALNVKFHSFVDFHDYCYNFADRCFPFDSPVETGLKIVNHTDLPLSESDSSKTNPSIYMNGEPHKDDTSWDDFSNKKGDYTLFIDERKHEVWSYGNNYSASLRGKRAFEMLCLLAKTPTGNTISYLKFYKHAWKPPYKKSRGAYIVSVQKQFEMNITPTLFDCIEERELFIESVPRKGYRTTDKINMVIRVQVKE